VQVADAARVTSVTSIVWDDVPTAPQVEVVKPGELGVTAGADQPEGMTTAIPPELVPPAAAVYVKVRVLDEPTTAAPGDTVNVPPPSASSR
jgi:hypothetical protein